MAHEAPITRKSFLKLGGKLAGALLAAPLGAYGYARLIEPEMIRVNELDLAFGRLPGAFGGTRIVQFSDVHLDYHFGIGRLRQLAERLQRLRPDLLVFTGDLYDFEIGDTGALCAEILGSLKAPLGKWAVLGNHDHYTDPAAVARVMEQGGFTVLSNRSFEIGRNGSVIRIAGVEDALHGSPDLDAALRRTTDGPFTILLAHEPDFADVAAAFPVDLQLSGHSHGGQVRIPFLGPLVVPELAKKYPDGLYKLGPNGPVVYTNRGIGVSTKPVRFACPPEITVFTLAAAADDGL